MDSAIGRPNNSALSLAWLVGHIRDDESGGHGSVLDRWRSQCEDMRAAGLLRPAHAPLDSDVWLCKSVSAAEGRLVPVWAPPHRLDDLTAAVGREQLAGWQFRDTRHVLVDDLVSARPRQSDEEALSTGQEALTVYTELHRCVQPPFSDPNLFPQMLCLNQCIAWLNAAVGVYFRGLVLTGIERPEVLLHLGSKSLERVEQVAHSCDTPFAETGLLAMYSATQPLAGAFEVIPAPAGQSERWRESWGWLSQDASAENARRALAMAAALLANPALVHPLLQLARQGDPASCAVALCTLRRMALGLRAMAWAEDALQWEWGLVRPKDILCFAYAALRPEWPRRSVALSHRSSTVKPRLVGTRFLRSPRAAVDATYIPRWESNIAMIWGLFAPARVVVRMASDAYRASEWCLRESELLDHLLERGDFLRDRVVIDAGESETARLDGLVDFPDGSCVPAFPPRVQLLLLPLLTEGAASVLRAAAAIRFIAFAARGRAEEVAIAVRSLCRGVAPSLTCPTNNARGWEDYVAIFRELAPVSTGELPIRLGADADPTALAAERDWWARNSPDFNDPRVPPLADHLCACEWQRVLGHSPGPEGYAQGFVIDCRELSREDWERDPARTLHRGFTSAATTVPVWFLQSAGDRVDRWAAIGDFRPIFTQHFGDQFAWMDARPAPADWPQVYLQRSDLVYSDVVVGCLAAT
jgi:hypothetical protein